MQYLQNWALGKTKHFVRLRFFYSCNMAIQDGLVLSNALESAEGDVNQALKLFNDARLKEVKNFQLLEKVCNVMKF